MNDQRRRIVICGAAGRDFHDFNRLYRGRTDCHVVAFTATQIPGVDSRTYPPSLCGPDYPDGIPILPEAELETICTRFGVNEVVFAYSDVPHAHVMQVGSRALAAGATFSLPGPRETMLASNRPVISVCAVRTGCGKSQVARYLTGTLAARGMRPAAIRHPMPYGYLERQAVQRFASSQDLIDAGCTLEEREEYEPHIDAGGVVFAGVDYEQILRAAELEADLIVWDGGNNDFAFITPDLSLVVVDALRPEQLDTHHPGTAVLRMADVVIINKVRVASSEQLTTVHRGLDRIVPDVPRVEAASPVTLDAAIPQGSRVLVVEDGPTITHGGMPDGAGYRAVRALPGLTIVDPRPFATPAIQAVYAQYPHIGPVLPAVGYNVEQLDALRATIDAARPDIVVAGTPINFARDLDLACPVVRARYRYADAGEPGLMTHINRFLADRKI
ncbi:MAG: GTPase [Pseudomonadales bacterium]|nr:GTPase [Pseudomonadales bacterium]MCP5183771.1 GTPase [Pseudomonadales bacterium]